VFLFERASSSVSNFFSSDLSTVTQKSKMQAEVEELQSQVVVKNQLHQTLQEQIQTLKDQLANMESKLAELSKPPMEASAADPQVSAEGEPIQEGETELSPEEGLSSIDAARWVCPKCGNNHRHMIREEEDKSIILNVAPRVYGKKLLCGSCGWKWHHQ
jgi:peptidoglycan hydrolase CwlO-like protein